MRIILLALLLTSCVAPQKLETLSDDGFSGNIRACTTACKTGTIEKFEACQCKVYKEAK